MSQTQLGQGSFVPISSPPTLATPPVEDDLLTVAGLVNEFLRAKARAGRSDRYLRALRNSLISFSYGRANVPAVAVKLIDVENWLNGHSWQTRTMKGYLGDVRTLFNFAVKRGYVQRNPAAGVELPVCDELTPSIHSPGQVTDVLNFARRYDPNICRALAVRYFTGIRSAECERIEEKDLHPEFIEVTAIKSKTRRRRLVDIQPNLAAWLAIGGALPVRGSQSNIWRDFTAALLKATAVPWHHNVTRHSFVSYHLAKFQNAGKTALLAGHTEAMLFAHYREIVTQPAAAEFFNILPK
ncbi:MAG: hypothetical protein WCS42_08410 [Verrucomicrobiota bacterium]